MYVGPPSKNIDGVGTDGSQGCPGIEAVINGDWYDEEILGRWRCDPRTFETGELLLSDSV